MNANCVQRLIDLGVDENAAAAVVAMSDALPANLPADLCWQRISRHIVNLGLPFAAHRLLFKDVYRDWQASQGPPPAWLPTAEIVRHSNIGALMRETGCESYAAFHQWTTQKREAFWEMMIQRLGIAFHKPYTSICDLSGGITRPRWLPGAELNVTDSCFKAQPDSVAIVYQEPNQPLRTLSVRALEQLSARVANGLVEMGLVPGDAIAVDMAMSAASVAIYLGIIRAGCHVVSISDSFAPEEIAIRLRITKAKAMFTQDVVMRLGKPLPLYAKVVAAQAPPAVVLGCLEGPPEVELRAEDRSWQDFLCENTLFDAVARDPEATTNVLFSSGTTGDPKAIPWTGITPIKVAVDGHLHHDIHPGDVIAWPTNLGWMMGPWLVYAALMNKASIALYNDAPTTRAFGEFIEQAGVTMLGLVPSLVKAWRNSACMEGLDWTRIKAFSSTGECSNAEDMLYLMMLAGYKPVIEYCGGTEIGGGYITGTLVQPSSPATFSTPALGLDIAVLDEQGKTTDNGEVFIIPPSMGLSNNLLNHDHHEVYYADVPSGPNGEVLRRHGDQIEILGAGFFRHHGRADDTMNLGGIKISSAEIERTLNHVGGVHETAAIAVPPEGGGPSQLIICLVLKPEAQGSGRDWQAELQQAIRTRLNPLFKIHDVKILETLPRTASNKVMRRLLRKDYQAE